MIKNYLAVILVAVALAASLWNTGCGQSAYPSYAGIYILKGVQYSGFGANADDPSDPSKYPFIVTLPRQLHAYQRNFLRSNGVTSHRLALLSEDASYPGLLFNQQLAYEGLTNSYRREDLSSDYDWEDENSPQLWSGGSYEGRACKFFTGAYVQYEVSPGTNVLDAVYPWCEEEKFPDGRVICVQPREWSDMSVDHAKWENAKMQLKITVVAYKKVRPGYDDDCPKPSYESRLVAVYDRVAAEDMGDPRKEDGSEADAKIAAAVAGKKSAREGVFQLPASGDALIPYFPDDHLDGY